VSFLAIGSEVFLTQLSDLRPSGTEPDPLPGSRWNHLRDGRQTMGSDSHEDHAQVERSWLARRGNLAQVSASCNRLLVSGRPTPQLAVSSELIG
jgi:hypothetical protein